jgi:hypothetical protein
MSALSEHRKKISEGVRRHYATAEGAQHRKKLSKAMKRKWKELKEGES